MNVTHIITSLPPDAYSPAEKDIIIIVGFCLAVLVLGTLICLAITGCLKKNPD